MSASKTFSALAAATLRHRILVSYRAEAEGVTVEQVIQNDCWKP